MGKQAGSKPESLKQAVIIACGVLLTPLCLCSSLFVVPGLIESYIIYQLTPPEYPGSQLVKTESGGGSGGTWTSKIYETHDDIDTVLKYFEQDLSGFREIELRPTAISAYYSSVEYNGWVSKFALSERDGGITIYVNPDAAAVTVIKVTIGYIDH